MLETVVRDRLRTIPRRAIEDTAVVDVVWFRGRRRTARDGRALRSAVAGTGRELAADLVVDASGRQSRAPEWLERPASNHPRRRCRLPLRVQYPLVQGTRAERWRASGGGRVSDRPLLPAQRTAGVLFPVEGGRWIVTIAGIAVTTLRRRGGLHGGARTLRSPLLAEPCASRSRSRRSTEPCDGEPLPALERSAEHPAGFLAVGDSVCAFNPIYGQGMTSAAVCARILETPSAPRSDSPGAAAPFFRAQARFLRDPWTLATAPTAHPGDAGTRPALLNVVARYMDALFARRRPTPRCAGASCRDEHARAGLGLLLAGDPGRVASGTLRRWAAVAELTRRAASARPDTVAAADPGSAVSSLARLDGDGARTFMNSSEPCAPLAAWEVAKPCSPPYVSARKKSHEPTRVGAVMRRAHRRSTTPDRRDCSRNCAYDAVFVESPCPRPRRRTRWRPSPRACECIRCDARATAHGRERSMYHPGDYA